MRSSSLGDLFVRFRDHGDIGAFAALFDRTAGDLRRVARSVARDAAEADDLLQGAYLKAIESAPSYDAARPVEPWLVGILLNCARNARRRRRPTADLDGESLPASADPSREAESRELEESLAAALARLPRGDRDVLAPHLSQGKSGAEIAREVGRSPGVVRMQIHRGLARLRRLLPAGHVAGAALPIGLGAPELQSLRLRVLEAAAVRAATLPAGALAAGGALVSQKAVVAILAAALLLAGFLLWNPGTPPASPPAATSGAAGAPQLADPTAPPGAASLSPAATDRVAAEPRPEGAAVSVAAALSGITGRVVEEDGRPVADAAVALLELRPARLFPQIQVSAVELPHGDELALGRTRTADDGRFRLQGARTLGAHALSIAAGGRRALRGIDRALPGGTTTDLGDFVLETGATLTGHVVDEDGAPVAGARVRALPMPLGMHPDDLRGLQDLREGCALVLGDRGDLAVLELPAWIDRLLRELPLPETASGTDGSFSLAGVAPGEVSVVVDRRGASGVVGAPFEVHAGRRSDLGAVALRRGRSVRGRVEAAGGEPAAGVEVAVAAVSGIHGLGVLQPAGRTDSSGRFALEGLPRDGTLAFALRRAEGAPWEIVADDGRGGPEGARLPLHASATLELEVAGAEGEPLDEISVLWAPASHALRDSELRSVMRLARADAEALGNGLHRVAGLPKGACRILLSGPGIPPLEREVELVEGTTRLRLEVPATRAIALRVLDAASGAPVEGAWTAVARSRRGEPLVAARHTDGSGSARLEPVPAGPAECLLLVHHPGYADVALALGDVPDGAGPFEVRLGHGAAIEGRLTIDGRPPDRPLLVALRPWRSKVSLGASVVLHDSTDPDGRFRFDRVPAGSHRWQVAERFFGADLLSLALSGELAQLYDADKGALEIRFADGEVELRDGETRKLDVPLRSHDLPRSGVVHGVVTVDGAPAPGLRVVADAEDRRHFSRSGSDGSFRFASVEEGRVRLRVLTAAEPRNASTGLLEAEIEIDLGGGEEERADFALAPATVRIRVADAVTGAAIEGARVSMRASRRTGLVPGAAPSTDRAGEARFVAQKRGTLRWTAESSGYVAASGDLEIAAPDREITKDVRLAPAVPCAGRVELSGFDPESRRAPLLQLDALDAPQGQSAPSARVSLADDGSSFEIDTLGPGRYRARIWWVSQESHPIEFDLPEAGARDLVLRFARK